MSNNNSNSGGISFFGVLTIVFIVLKLCKVIDWSWWWVTCPLWGLFAIILICLPFYFIYKIRKGKDERNRIEAGYNGYGWKKEGKSKWQQRLDAMQEAQKLKQKK
jgi:4-amino-4-deoxy-L-arabinose transferase-like glycosyltransferase